MLTCGLPSYAAPTPSALYSPLPAPPGQRIVKRKGSFADSCTIGWQSFRWGALLYHISTLVKSLNPPPFIFDISLIIRSLSIIDFRKSQSTESGKSLQYYRSKVSCYHMSDPTSKQSAQFRDGEYRFESSTFDFSAPKLAFSLSNQSLSF